MIIAVHQPNYLPYLGFFDKMNNSDIFVIYDDAQFSKGDFHHRNKIRTYQGWKWLTVPVEKKCMPINKIRIKHEVNNWKGINWIESHLKEIEDNYKNTPYFLNYKGELENIYNNYKYNMLSDLNIQLILFLKKIFDIETEIVLSSELVKMRGVNPQSQSSERLLEIVQALNGDTYLSGTMGNNYLNKDIFENNGIKVNFQEFDHPVYVQNYKGFIPNMASIDALFNIGEMPK